MKACNEFCNIFESTIFIERIMWLFLNDGAFPKSSLVLLMFSIFVGLEHTHPEIQPNYVGSGNF